MSWKRQLFAFVSYMTFTSAVDEHTNTACAHGCPHPSPPPSFRAVALSRFVSPMSPTSQFTEIRRQFKSIKLRREAAFTPAQGTLATSRVAYEAAISPAVTRNINRERLAQQPSKIKPPTKRATVRASPKKSTASPRRTPVKCGALLATSKFPESESGPPNSTMGAVGAARSSKTTVGQRKPSPSKSSARMPTTPESPMNTRGKDRRAPSLPSGPTRLSSSRKKNVAPKSDGNEGERKPSETSPKSTPSKRGASSLLEMARSVFQLCSLSLYLHGGRDTRRVLFSAHFPDGGR